MDSGCQQLNEVMIAQNECQHKNYGCKLGGGSFYYNGKQLLPVDTIISANFVMDLGSLRTSC